MVGIFCSRIEAQESERVVSHLDHVGRPPYGRDLFRARRVRLARRHQNAGPDFRPHRLRQPRRFRQSIEPQQPPGEVAITPLQRLQQGFLGGIGKLVLHDGKS